MGLDEVDRMQWEMVTPTLKVMIQPQRPPKAALRLALQALNLYAILVGGSSSDMRCESLAMRRKLCIPARSVVASWDNTSGNFLSSKRRMYPISLLVPHYPVVIAERRD